MNRSMKHGWLLFVGLLLAVGHADAAPTTNPQVLHSFCKCTGPQNPTQLIRGPDGSYYGITQYASGGFSGVVYQIDPATRETRVLHSFDWATEGQFPTWLTFGSDGNLYGALGVGAGSDRASGVFYQLSPATNTFRALVVSPLFSFYNGIGTSELVEDAQGNWYGATINDNLNTNEIFRVDPAGNITTLHTFSRRSMGGFYTNGRLVLAQNGNLYGTTYSGGRYGDGTLFRMTTDGAFAVLHHFDFEVDGIPFAPLTIGPGEGLYGTSTVADDANGQIGLFRLSPAGKFTLLGAFGPERRMEPTIFSALTFMPDGYFYGIRGGVIFPQSTLTLGIFRVSRTGTDYSTLYEFSDPQGVGNGNPVNELLRGSDNALYGTSTKGGKYAAGTIYRYVPPPVP